MILTCEAAVERGDEFQIAAHIIESFDGESARREIVKALIEKGRTQLDGIKEGISDKMLSALKNTYIEKVKIIERSIS